MNGLRETCHCGHDKSSHYRDAGDGKLYSCLARGCDDCKAYVNENDPKPVKVPTERPRHASWCKCARCREYDAAHPPITTPMIEDFDPDTGI